MTASRGPTARAALYCLILQCQQPLLFKICADMGMNAAARPWRPRILAARALTPDSMEPRGGEWVDRLVTRESRQDIGGTSGSNAAGLIERVGVVYALGKCPFHTICSAICSRPLLLIELANMADKHDGILCVPKQP